MPTEPDLFRDLPSAEWDRLDSILGAFEAALVSGERPRISDQLPAPPASSLPLLVELVHLDLEYRLKAGEAVRVEAYLQEHPALTAQPGVVLDLLATEFRFRRLCEPGVSVEEYLGRFPQYRDELPGRLRVDSVRPGQLRRPAVPAPAAPDTPAPMPTAHSVDPATPRRGDLPTPEAAAAPSETLQRAGGPAPSSLPPPAWAPANLPGYEVLAELGRGGMGVVYQARQLKLNRVVALKMILAGRHAGPEQRGRFLTEARAAARLQHPNIVQVYEVGEHQDLPYFSLEFVGGGSLARKLAGAPQPARYAAALVQALARGMHLAHQQGVVHRDLKPANVLLTPEGTPKVTDFGLAKELGDEDGRTRTGEVMGTPSYMAPEQALGHVRGIGPAADVWALGAILYECLTGRPPFRGPTALETLEQVRTREPVAPRSLQPGVPRDLELICLKCLQKDPHRRYASAEQLADELRRHLSNEPLRHTRAVGRAERAWRWCRRNRALAVSGGLALLFLTVGLLVSMVLLAHEARQAESLGRANRDLGSANAELAEKKRLADKETARAEGALKKFLGADRGRARFARLAGELFLERGLALCEKEGAAAGLPWLCAALQVTPPEDPLQRRIRLNVVDWGQTLGAAIFPHPDAVTAEAFTPDGATILTACADRQVRLWDAATARLLGEPIPLPEPAAVVAFAPEGRTFVAGSTGVHLWDVATRKSLREFPHPNVTSAAFHPGGKRLLLAGAGELRLWDLTTGERLWEVTPKHSPGGPQDTIPQGSAQAVFSPDGKTVVVTYLNGELDLRDASTGKPLRPPEKGELPGGNMAAFSPDGRLFATASSSILGKTIRLWETSTGKPWESPVRPRVKPEAKLLAAGELPVEMLDVRALTFSADGKTLVAVGSLLVQRLDVATGKAVGDPLLYDRDPRSIQHLFTSQRVLLRPDGGAFLWVRGSRVELWRTPPATPAGDRASFAHPNVQTAALSPDGALLLTAGGDPAPKPQAREARRWDATTGKPLGEPLPHAGAVLAVAVSPDGKTFVTASEDGLMRRWEVTTGKPLAPPFRPAGTAPALAVAFSPDGNLVAAATGAGHADVYETPTGKLRAALGFDLAGGGMFGGTDITGAMGKVTTGFSADAKKLWIRSGGFSSAWDIASGQPVAPSAKSALFEIRGQSPLYRALDLAPEGVAALTKHARDPRLAVLIDRNNDQPLGEPLRHEEAVTDGAFSPDGKAVVTVTAKHARVWDVAAGKALGPPLPLTEPPLTAVFAPGNKLVLLAGAKSARLWEVPAGEARGEPLPHDGPVTVAAFSPDGKFLVTGTGKLPAASLIPGRPDLGEARVWDVGSGKAVGKPARLPGPPANADLLRGGKLFLTYDPRHDAVLVWDTATGRPPGAAAPAEDPPPPPKGGAAPVLAAASSEARLAVFSPDGKFLVICDNRTPPVARAHLLDAPTGVPVRAPLTVRGTLYRAAFSRNGKFLLTAGLNPGGASEVRTWEAATGKPVGRPLPHPGPVRVLACSPDGARVVTGTATGFDVGDTIRLWDVATGIEVGVGVKTGMVVRSLAFSPDGKLFASAENPGLFGAGVLYADAVRLWDAETGTRVGRPLPHSGPIHALVFTADGSTLVTASSAAQGPFGGVRAGYGTDPLKTRVEVRRWRMPAAPSGAPERLVLWAELLTGMEVDESGTTRALDAAALQARRERLRELGGPPAPTPGQP